MKQAILVVFLSATTLVAQSGPNDQRARDIFKELIEINTTDSVGDTTQAAKAMAARLKSAGFADADMRIAQLLGGHAAILVGYALACTELNDQLRQAVATREVIGTAKGILMQSQSCSRDEAFDILRRASQRQNRKLRDIAEELVERVESRGGGNAGRK
jgi:hypothetical protein